MPELNFSIIIPVFNRPAEVEEILESLSQQTRKNFEVIIVEDGSKITCDAIVAKYKPLLNLTYYFKENTGPGTTRNYGCEKASGNYFIFLDSDCIVPPQYMEVVAASLSKDYKDAFGGPDRASEKFTNLQKAINYAMTSFFTTGGIRGGGEKLDAFYPRSFNMGYSQEVFTRTGGFSKMRFGEDIDMSIRILKNGFKTKLIREAYVYHKRRSNFRQFFKQVYNSGIARVNLYIKYPESLKLVHLLPSFFALGIDALLFLSIVFSGYFMIPVLLLMLLLLVDATIRNKSIVIGCLSVVAAFIQLMGYGYGFLAAFWKRIILKKDEFSSFESNFYK